MDGVEVLCYEGSDYQPVMSFKSWRVAFLNYGETQDENIAARAERHLLTDEVFVLLKGSAQLLIGKDKKRLPMELCKVYNVKQGVWHCVNMSRDAKILIIEEDNTSADNSEYSEIDG